MQNLFTPLTDQEVNQLDDFLLDRVDEDEYVDGMDEGILDISMLDGFMTAIVSGPDTIPPSVWLPAIWGDFEPTWKSKKEFEQIFTLMVRHINTIASMLIESSEEFEPLFLERIVDDKTYLIADEWCEGYLRAVRMNANDWFEVEEVSDQLKVISLFASQEGWEQLKGMTDEEVAYRQGLVAQAVRDIHAYWYALRIKNIPGAGGNAKVGRNDPCPCGSGQKYKKCCGTGPTLH